MKGFRTMVCLPIRCYQWTLSPLKQSLLGAGAGCRFQPTCSNYAIEAIQGHGVMKGLQLAVRRILSCHPWGGQGWDPVPTRQSHDINPANTRSGQTVSGIHDP
ncbi:MAG: membrane protein insertion efficiency factor YidD [Verrucomicrobiota bacterium]|nr:membrane protein insertion efficiency factor YidD [Verrucomicrobiota bacterium]